MIVGSNRRTRAIALVAAVLVLVAIATAWWVLTPAPIREVRIATGQRGGTFLPLGETLAAGFAHDVPGVRFSALESAGGQASIEMLEAQQAELALLSNHIGGNSSLQLIAPLYPETLHVVARTQAAITGPLDLHGKRVNVGPAGSGTESIADSVLVHFGVVADRKNLALADAVAQLQDGRLDAAFIVGGMRTPAVDGLLARDDMQLVSLGDPGRVGSALEGIRVDAPFLSPATIPERAYGDAPPEPVGTIAVHALLVTRTDLDEDLVYAITESMFSHKAELARHDRLLSHLSERYDPAISPYAVHPGAERFLRRDEPTFVQRHEAEIGLALTIGAILWSAITALRAWRRQSRRNRVETHYAAARAAIEQLRDEPDRRATVRARLVQIRDEALAELADEQLDADTGFAILQDYLSTRVAEIDRMEA